MGVPSKDLGRWTTIAIDIEQVNPGKHDAVKFTVWIDGQKGLEWTNTKSTPWTDVPDQNRVWDIALNNALGGNYVGRTEYDLGFIPKGDLCATERDQRSTSDPSSCKIERTQGRWYNDIITKAPAPDGVPDVWLAPWAEDEDAEVQYVLDYIRVYTPK